MQKLVIAIVGPFKGQHKFISSLLPFHLMGKQVVSSSDDQSILVWDAEGTSQCSIERAIQGHTDRVMSAAFYTRWSQNCFRLI